MLPVDSLDYDSRWTCSCGKAWPCEEIAALEEKVEDKINKLIAQMAGAEEKDVLWKLTNDAQNLMKELTQNLQPIRFCSTHYLMMKLKSHLITHFGSLAQTMKDQSTDFHVKRIQFCNEFIDIFDKVEQGGQNTDWWAGTMYEKLKSELALDQSNGNNVKLLSEQLRTYYLVNWRKILKILQLEYPGSYLYKKSEVIAKDIKMAEEMMRMIDFL